MILAWEQPEDLTVEELRRRRNTGRRYVQVVIHRKRRPSGYRVRVIPGAYGRCIGPLPTGGYLIDVLLDDMIAAMVKRSNG